MNKKILIGSIIAVVILILVSFTGVVGYQTTKSSAIARASPLFSVRSSRAIDEESKEFTCDYVGKGEDTKLSFLISNSRNTQIKRIIDKINGMDDKTFTKFVKLFVYQLNNKNKMKDINNNAIIDELFQIKANPKLLKNDDSLWTKGECTSSGCPTEERFCFLELLIRFIIIYIREMFCQFFPSSLSWGCLSWGCF